MNTKLKYISQKGSYISGIPARDLTDVDLVQIQHVSQYDLDDLVSTLVGTGLYEEYEEYKCGVCDKPYKSAGALQRHELSHYEDDSQEEIDNG
jgi:hypothetical protein